MVTRRRKFKVKFDGIHIGVHVDIRNWLYAHRPFSYSEKESQSNDTLLQFVEVSNVHNTERSSNTTRSNRVYKNV